MVSSGISGNIGVLMPAQNTGAMADKSQNVDFGAFMMQSVNKTTEAENAVPGPKTEQIDVLADRMPKSSNRIQEKKYSESKENESVRTQDKTTDKINNSTDTETKVQDAVKKVTDKIKEKFGVTDEEINATLETLGLSVMDLLDTANLTDFFVKLTGLDSAVDLLVSPKLAEGLNDLTAFAEVTIEEAADELGISVEELMEKVSEMSKSEPDLQNGHLETFDNTAPEEVMENIGESDKTQKNEFYPKDKAQLSNAQEEITIKTDSVQTKEVKATVKQETNNDSSQTGHNENMPDMTGNMVDKFAKAVEQAFEVRETYEFVEPAQIVEQIIETARINLNQEVTSMEMMLNPESLGKVNLNISVKEGVVTASFVTQNEVAREAIESQISVLKENFNQQGLKVEAVEVTVESRAFDSNAGREQNNEFNEQHEEAAKKSRRPLRLDSLDDLSSEDLTEGERIVLDMMANEGNQVNFTA